MKSVTVGAEHRGQDRRQRRVMAVADDATFGTNVPRYFLIAIDVLSLTGAFFSAYVVAPRVRSVAISGSLLHDWVFALSPDVLGEFRPMREMAWVLYVMIAVTVLGLQLTGGYRPLPSQTRTQVALSAVLAPLVGLGAIALIPFSLKTPQWSRVFIFTFAGLSIVWVAGYRLLIRWYQLRRIDSGFYARHIVLAGSSRAVAWMAEHMRRTTSPAHYLVVGMLRVADPPFGGAADADTPDLPLLGDVDDFAGLLVHQPIHEVIAIQGSHGGDWLRSLVDTCDYFRITLRLVPEALIFGSLKDLQYVYRADPLRLPEVVLRPRDFASDALFVKRIIDILVSAALLVVLAPLFAAIAIAIKVTTPALPVFYRWQVVGFKGRRFTGYKFTTMVADAEERRAALTDRNEMEGPVFKIKEDPRVTRLGWFLRKFSLNELPQLWSVLKGDMSLVGPRPAFPHELRRYELWHKRKLCVRPGITCLWQVSGRNRIWRFDDWVRMDLEYIDNWTLWLDMKILARTVWAVVAGSGS
ncbi:MAG TPA: sugar transferase [Vicinamibacterales bacterium]|nr:sugar transferase [Vicinamibacterales bacterium]